jgi:hypothetical protein
LRGPRIIRALSERTIEVAEMGPWAMYRDHASTSLSCGCGLAEPDAECGRGVSLWRIATIPQRPVSSGLLLREMLAPPHPRSQRW